MNIRDNNAKEKNLLFLLFFARFFVPLHPKSASRAQMFNQNVTKMDDYPSENFKR